MQEIQDGSLIPEDLLEKEVAPHSSVLAWEIPWTEEPGGLQSMGWQKSQTQLSSNNNKHQHVIVNLEQKKTTNKFSQKSITITLLISSFPTSLSLDLLVKVAQSCLTLCDPTDHSPLDSFVHGISQARTLEWVAISFSRRSSRSRDQTRVSCIGRQILDH